MAQYDLSFTAVSVPAGAGSTTVRILEDSDADGTVENTDTVALADGTTAYTTNDVFAGSGDVALDITAPAGSDVTVSETVTFPVDVTVASGGGGGGSSTGYDLSFNSVSIPAGSGGVAVRVLEDSDTDGTVENTDTVTLSDGTTAYTTADGFAQSGDVALDFEMPEGSDLTVGQVIGFPVEVTVPATTSPPVSFITTTSGSASTTASGSIETS